MLFFILLSPGHFNKIKKHFICFFFKGSFWPMHVLSQSKPQCTKTCLAPAFGLFFLSPLVGEFLLGNLPITWLWALPTLAPLYGGGALLIRETARRMSLGWPGMIVMGLAFAMVEEAFVTQSLFNPDYLGLRLLDYGYISSLGMGAWWTVFVLGIHTVWSTAVPIALVESLTPEARRSPWLGPVGLSVTAVIFIAGCILLFIFQQQQPFMASSLQLISSAAVVAALIALAISTGRVKSRERINMLKTPGTLAAGGAAFGLGSAYMSLALLVEKIPAFLNAGAMLTLFIAGIALFRNWSKRPGWSGRHSFGLASGLLLVYVWYGFVQAPSTGDIGFWTDTAGNAIFASGALAFLYFAHRKLRESELANGDQPVEPPA